MDAALSTSRSLRWTAAALIGVIVYLLLGQLIDPGFTDYWWYQLVQTSATLATVIALDTLFAAEDGLAWQTHVIVVLTTVTDTLGTAGHLYDAFGPYDKIVHFWSGAAFSAATYETVGFLRERGTIQIGRRKQAIIAVTASLLLAGVLWETYEYVSDVVFGSGRVNGRWDTSHDIASDVLGAIFAVLVLRYWSARRQPQNTGIRPHA